MICFLHILLGFEGTYCEVDTDECASFPCGNNGYCVQPQMNMYECRCQAGYNGPNCENDIDECAQLTPCQPHQICVDLINGFRYYILIMLLIYWTKVFFFFTFSVMNMLSYHWNYGSVIVSKSSTQTSCRVTIMHPPRQNQSHDSSALKLRPKNKVSGFWSPRRQYF